MAKDFSSYTDPPYPRGIVNNNPGNLTTGDNWVGISGTDGPFLKFKDVSYGLRAMAIDLSNKIKKGYNTITKLITRYSPPSENPTQAYINNVVRLTGIDADTLLVANQNTLLNLMRAQIQVELGDKGSYLIDDNDILEGISMIPQSIVSRVTDFFVNSPIAAVAVSYGAVAVVIIIVVIISTLIIKGKINLKKIYQ